MAAKIDGITMVSGETIRVDPRLMSRDEYRAWMRFFFGAAADDLPDPEQDPQGNGVYTIDSVGSQDEPYVIVREGNGDD